MAGLSGCFQRVPRADADPPLPARAAQTYRGAMLRVLALIVAAIVVVLVAMAVVGLVGMTGVRTR